MSVLVLNGVMHVPFSGMSCTVCNTNAGYSKALMQHPVPHEPLMKSRVRHKAAGTHGLTVLQCDTETLTEHDSPCRGPSFMRPARLKILRTSFSTLTAWLYIRAGSRLRARTLSDRLPASHRRCTHHVQTSEMHTLGCAAKLKHRMTTTSKSGREVRLPFTHRRQALARHTPSHAHR